MGFPKQPVYLFPAQLKKFNGCQPGPTRLIRKFDVPEKLN